MTRSGPGQRFLETFNETVTSKFLQALQSAYETAAEHYEPERGNNRRTFGYEVYHCAVHELALEARDSEGLFGVLSRDPSFRLRAGEFELACHRVGNDGSDNIWSSFPENNGAACQMVEQLWLAGMEPDIDKARKVVIAHLGNPEDGLQALYLCIASRTHKHKIIEWGLAHLVWRADDDRAQMTMRGSGPILPEETIEDPMVRRRHREGTDEVRSE